MRCIKISGSFFQGGFQFGEACKEDIAKLYDWLVPYMLQNTSVGNLKQLQEAALEYSSTTDRVWPRASMFLRGQAEGAKVPFEKIAITAYSEDILSTFVGSPLTKCSTLVVGDLIVHNEDFGEKYPTVIVDAELTGLPRMISAAYIGMFPGAVSLNADLVATLNNSLWPQGHLGISRGLQQFYASFATSLSEAVGRLTQPPVGTTTHYTVADGYSGRVISLEVSNSYIVKGDVVSKLEVGRKPFGHTNLVSHLRLRAPDPAVVAKNHTVDRQAKLEKIISQGQLPCTPAGMLDFFSTNDGVLHRTAEQNPDSRTIFTAAIQFGKDKNGYSVGEIWFRDADQSVPVTERDYHFKFTSSRRPHLIIN